MAGGKSILGQPLLSETQKNFLWRIWDGAFSKEHCQPWQRGLARILLGIGVILLRNFIESDNRVICYTLPRSMTMSRPEARIRCSCLLPISSEGLAVLTRYVSAWLRGQVKGEKEDDEQIG